METEDLVDRLKAEIAAKGDDQTVFIKGDRDVPYGRVIEVLDTLQQGGIVNVGMVTEKETKGGRSRS